MTLHTKKINEVVDKPVNAEKSIKQFVAEFKAAFEFDEIDGERVPNGTKVEFKAVNHATGVMGGSSGWIEPPMPRLEISSEDYRRLGDLRVGAPKPSAGVVSGLFKIMLGRR